MFNNEYTYGSGILSDRLAGGIKNEYNIVTPWDNIVISSLCSFCKHEKQSTTS